MRLASLALPKIGSPGPRSSAQIKTTLGSRCDADALSETAEATGMNAAAAAVFKNERLLILLSVTNSLKTIGCACD